MIIGRKLLRFIIGTVFIVAIFVVGENVAYAQDVRSYQYDEITTNITVNKDSTIDIEEKQVYDFRGEYHLGWRSIQNKGYDSISDIVVIDGVTLIPLTYTSSRLDKTDSSSWGKYTNFSENGSQVIEWYYDAKDEQRSFILRYKVHGAISYLDTHDEIYWNLFTDYKVPVSHSKAIVKLPEVIQDFSKITSSYYDSAINGGAKSSDGKIVDNQFVEFETYNVNPEQGLTVSVGWPKGITLKSEYWKDFCKTFWGGIIAFITIILTILGALIYWIYTEKFRQGRGAIITQFEPEMNLRPAMVEMIVKERISTQTWAATVIDLAVREYLKIEEEEDKGFLASINKRFSFLKQKDYLISKIKDFNNDSSLCSYEQDFLKALFMHGEIFSTSAMRKSTNMSLKREFGKKIQKLSKTLQTETAEKTKAYAVDFKGNNSRVIVLMVFMFGTVFGWNFFSAIDSQIKFVAVSICFVFVIIYWLSREPRLNKDGQIIKENLLGFKRYLRVVEGERVQNLTPELFQKYLPYAMIFGIEKEWARAFSGISMSQPDWYHSANAVAISGGLASFDSSSFASSLGSSFASSFSSSGGGASGGGGSAGGGGGGGGGGAS